MDQRDPDLRARFPDSFGYVISLKKTAIRVTPITRTNAAYREDDATLGVAQSKLGGGADFPSGVDWPRRDDHPMPFLAQFNLAELAPFDVDAILPKEGLLLFFLDEAGGSRVGRVFHFADTSALVRVAPPSGTLSYGPAGVAFSRTSSFPLGEPFVFLDDIAKKERARYDELLRAQASEVGPSVHQLLGYATDEVDGLDGDSRLLLELRADPTVGFDFTTPVRFFAQDAELRQANFGKIRVR